MKTIPTHPVLETLISSMKDGKITTILKRKDLYALGHWLRELSEQDSPNVEQIEKPGSRNGNEYVVNTLKGKIRIGVRGIEIFAILQTS